MSLPHLQADCTEIREQLAILSRGALLSGLLRDHIEHCEGCRAFATEVRHQHTGLEILLRVVSSRALKHSTLTAAAAGSDADLASGTTVALTRADQDPQPSHPPHPPR